MTGIWETNQAVTKKVHFITLALATLYCTCHCWPKIFDVSFLRGVTPKSVPPKIGPAGLIWQKICQNQSPPDYFCCQNWSCWTNFGCQKWFPLAKISPPWGTHFGKKISAKIGPPQSGTLIPVRTWLHGCIYYI